MEKVNQIYESSVYKELLNELELLEENRSFCKHDLNHFLSFARIAYIKALEEKIDISKEVIYAVALLHDIGRVKEYNEGIPHHKASIDISKEILKDTTYTKDEKDLIIKLISSHRENDEENKVLELIYKSDKLSRECFRCEARKDCYWAEEKRNMTIKY